MAERRPLVAITGQVQELPLGDSLPGGLPPAGTTGQVLTKASAADNDVAWQTPTAGGDGLGLGIAMRNKIFHF